VRKSEERSPEPRGGAQHLRRPEWEEPLEVRPGILCFNRLLTVPSHDLAPAQVSMAVVQETGLSERMLGSPSEVLVMGRGQ
jgi:hypothetical protein